jgi:MFS family permease
MSQLPKNGSPTRKPSGGQGFFYGYILIAAAFGLETLIWGVYNAYGIFFNPLSEEFGWSRATISGAISLSQIFVGVGAVSMGYLNDRFGPRALMTGAVILIGLGYFLVSRTESVWQLYLFQGVIVGIGISGTDIILLSTTARWFVRRRGMMSGIVKIGTGVGIMIAPMAISWLISAYGWRDTFVIIGLTIAVVGAIASQLLKRDPHSVGQYPDGEKLGFDMDITPQETGQSLGQAIRTRRFLTLGPAFFIILFCTFSVIVHFARYVTEIGFSDATGATMISVIGGVSIAGRLIMGIVGDRAGSKTGLLICFVLMVAAFTWAQFARELWALVVFTLFYGLSHGGFYALISPTIAEFFGLRAHGSIFGAVVLFGSVGGALGPLVTGRIADVTGGYQPAFIVLALLAVVGFLLILGAGPVPAKTPAR